MVEGELKKTTATGNRRRINRRTLAALLLLLFAWSCVAVWVMWPAFLVASLRFADKKSEEAGVRMKNRIVACGPRAIPAVINGIRKNSPWFRPYAYLPAALGQLGEPAHKALLDAVDSEQNPKVRAYLISSLQNGFGDFSRFEVYLKDAQAGLVSESSARHMTMDLRTIDADCPDLMQNAKVSAKFTQWWALHKDKIVAPAQAGANESNSDTPQSLR